tara:strand:- start:567 stop:785 length:219 start_codon:yes stop_codon:yes gene_type:complete
MNDELLIESRYDRTEYLLETALDEEKLLWDIVGAMSDREFHGVYKYICRMRDIEPDMELFQKKLEAELASNE